MNALLFGSLLRNSASSSSTLKATTAVLCVLRVMEAPFTEPQSRTYFSRLEGGPQRGTDGLLTPMRGPTAPVILLLPRPIRGAAGRKRDIRRPNLRLRVDGWRFAGPGAGASASARAAGRSRARGEGCARGRRGPLS